MPAITRELNVLARCGNQFRSGRLAELHLTAAQSPYILHICARPGMSQEQVAQALHVNPSNATRQLGALEQQGYITRETSPQDRRLMALHPTEKALAAVPVIRGVNQQWHDYLTQGMTDSELAMLEDLLERMRQRAVAWAAGEGVTP